MSECQDGVEGPLTAYIITIQWNGAEWRAMAWPANVSTLDDVVFARGAIGAGVLALDNEAWQAGADALAAAMPENEDEGEDEGGPCLSCGQPIAAHDEVDHRCPNPDGTL